MYKTKADLHRAWADTIEMTDSYNKEHKAKVDIKNCWQCKGALFGRRPTFDSDPALYSFAKGILYNEETKKHVPVFIGDKLWSFYTDSWYTVEQYSGSRFTDIFSWNKPKEKETFVLTSVSSVPNTTMTKSNYVTCPCPSNNRTQHALYLTKNNIFYFDSKEELEVAHKALFAVLTSNKQKGN